MAARGRIRLPAGPEAGERLRGFAGATRPPAPRNARSRVWPLEQAEELDEDGNLAGQIREAVIEVLGLLEEPPLPPPRR
jgi:hypothetical protein